MDREELYDFQMFLKRDKDDEELDLQSERSLKELHTRYVVGRPRKDVNELLEKYSRQVRELQAEKKIRERDERGE